MMNGHQTRFDPRGDPRQRVRAATEQGYLLLEEARLRCEQLAGNMGSASDRNALTAIHKQLGLAGWIVSSDLEPDCRMTLLTRAQRRSIEPLSYPTAELDLVEIVVIAEDAVTAGLADSEETEPLYLARVHLLRAMDLLHCHLYRDEPPRMDHQ
jgi:hypothetical protein